MNQSESEPQLQPGVHYLYRPPTEQDLGFVVSSWIKSQRNSDASAFIDNASYYPWQHNRISQLLAKSTVTMIADPQEPAHVMGYAVYQMTADVLVLHFLYIKQAYRNMGLARAMLRGLQPQLGQAPIVLTHIDPTRTKLVKNRHYPQDSDQEYLIKHTSAFVKKRQAYQLLYRPFLVKD